MYIDKYIHDIADYLCGISINNGEHIDILIKYNYVFSCFPNDYYDRLIDYMYIEVNKFRIAGATDELYIAKSLSHIMAVVANLYIISGKLE